MPEKETTNFKLPYPTTAGEVKKGAVDIEELAVKVDTVLKEHTLIWKNRGASYEAVSGEFGYVTGEYTVTLPSAATANQIIGVFAVSSLPVKITASGGTKINGDFINEVSTITLTGGQQHVILMSDGGIPAWRIIAGEPKREQTYSALASSGVPVEFTPSAYRPSMVNLTISASPSAGVAEIVVGGVKVGAINQPGEHSCGTTVYVPPGQSVKVALVAGTISSVERSILLL